MTAVFTAWHRTAGVKLHHSLKQYRRGHPAGHPKLLRLETPLVVNYSSLNTISPHNGRRSFSVAGPAAWNCLCDELREPL